MQGAENGSAGAGGCRGARPKAYGVKERLVTEEDAVCLRRLSWGGDLDMVVVAARLGFSLPYFWARMRCRARGDADLRYSFTEAVESVTLEA